MALLSRAIVPALTGRARWGWPDAYGTRRQDETAGVSEPGVLRVSVTAPAGIRGTVPVAIARENGSVDVRRVPIGAAPTPIRDVAAGVISIGVIDDRSGGAVLRELHETCAWPAPVSLALTPDDTVEPIEFSFTSRATGASLLLRARLSDGAPVQGVEFELALHSSGGSVLMPVAFPVTDSSGLAVACVQTPAAAMARVMTSPGGVTPVPPTEVRIAAATGVQTESSEAVFRFLRGGRLRGAVVAPTSHGRRHSVSVYHEIGSRFVVLDSIATDERGEFSRDGLPVGRYYATVWSPGYKKAVSRFEIRSGEETSVGFPLEPGGLSVRAQIVDPAGQPVHAARFNLNRKLSTGVPPSGRPFATDDSGQLVCDGVEDGEHLLIGWDLHIIRRIVVGRATAGEVLDLGVLRIQARVPGRRVTGRLTDTQGRRLSSGAWVCLREQSARESDWAAFATTDGEGRFSIDDIDPGLYWLWVEPGPVVNGFDSLPDRRVDVTGGDAVIDVELSLP